MVEDLSYKISIPDQIKNLRTPEEKVMYFLDGMGIKRESDRRKILEDYSQSSKPNIEICRTVLNRFDDFTYFVERYIA